MRILKFAIIFFFITLTGCDNSLRNNTYTLDYAFTQSKANEALEFCKAKRMNEDFCILIDMGIHSGRKRFFVWDFRKESIVQSFLAGHGCCDKLWGQAFSKENPKFSNVESSHCSSLGKFKIGERGYSSWGVKIKYLLHGLESSNSNALSRDIYLSS